MAIVTATATLLSGKAAGDSGNFDVIGKNEKKAREAYAALSRGLQSDQSTERRKQLQDVGVRCLKIFTVYRVYDVCVEWCKLALANYDDAEKSCDDYADVLSAFALSLSHTSTSENDLLDALKQAREAIVIKPKSARNLAVWFECALKAEIGGLIEAQSIIDEFNKLAKICQAEMRTREMLDALTMIARSCKRLKTVNSSNSAGDDTCVISPSRLKLLIFVLSTWIKVLGNPRGLLRDVAQPRKSGVRASKPLKSTDDELDLLPGNKVTHPLLRILQVFLIEVEEAVASKVLTFEYLQQEISTALDIPLRLLVKVRERTATKDKIDAGIFEDPATRAKVGDKSSCVWVAEKCWNLGILAMGGRNYFFASEFFAKAHDFAFMSHEEEGQRFTGGYLGEWRHGCNVSGSLKGIAWINLSTHA